MFVLIEIVRNSPAPEGSAEVVNYEIAVHLRCQWCCSVVLYTTFYVQHGIAMHNWHNYHQRIAQHHSENNKPPPGGSIQRHDPGLVCDLDACRACREEHSKKTVRLPDVSQKHN